jgi:glycosyltransferase involved in cell wall biosynthesis
MTTRAEPVRVTFLAEQLLQPIPGGIGTYVRAMLRALPPLGVQLDPVVAWHRASELEAAGLSHARRLPYPRGLLYSRWPAGRRPHVGGDSELVHAPSLAFPPRDERPLVVTVHDVLFRDFPEAYPKRGVEFHEASLANIGRADRVICPSEATAKAVREVAGAKDAIRVIPMGTDLEPPPDVTRDADLARLDVKRPYVLWVGTVEPRKNPEGIVRGFVHAIESGVPRADELSLYLVGPPGWWRGEIGALLESKSMSERVRRIDHQPRSVLASLYAGAEAFVMPSLAEGFGLPVIEAMACGAPVVCSDRSSLPEVAGSAALLCDPTDHASIGNALAKILRDAELADDLRRLGRRRAAEFSWRRTAEATASCYRELL